ncbi:unnamed protein product [Clonostachys rosea]|uniref:Heterokaryon incompatibility domain-containing protein n=1 Tax=Bionectria ochroleuca TaxID=29856 RepID=A0ABY6TXZ9_BIOOC|nr:unnamed protein product [Clonostachys rosea]
MLGCSCATLMVLLAQRAEELHYSEQNTQRMHIITISNDLLDTRIERLCVQHSMPGGWAWPELNTYVLEWARHGTRGDVSLDELCGKSDGSIQHTRIEPAASGSEWAGLVSSIVQRVQSSDNKRHLVLCFQGWDRIIDLDSELGKVPGIYREKFVEASWNPSRSGFTISKTIERIGVGGPGSPKFVYMVFLDAALPETLTSCVESLSAWDITLILGTTVMSHLVQAQWNHLPMLGPVYPRIWEQLNQLAWARLTDTNARIYTAASEDESLLKHWGDRHMAQDVKKELFPSVEPEGGPVKIETEQIAGFICSMVGLGVACDARAAINIGRMVMCRDAMFATFNSLRYQGTISGEMSNLRLVLPQGMGDERTSHALFVELTRVFGGNHTLAWIICSSWSDSVSDDWYLAIIIASALSIGLDNLIDPRELDNVVDNMESGLDALVNMCTGPFAKLADSGTVWLKLALMHRAAWKDDNFFVRVAAATNNMRTSFPVTIQGTGDDKYIVNIFTAGINSVTEKAADVADIIKHYTGQDHTADVWKVWEAEANDETRRRLHTRMLSAFVNNLAWANPIRRSLQPTMINNEVLPQYEYLEAIAFDTNRIQPGVTPALGAMLGVPRQFGSILDIGEWMYIPLELVTEWHRGHQGE